MALKMHFILIYVVLLPCVYASDYESGLAWLTGPEYPGQSYEENMNNKYPSGYDSSPQQYNPQQAPGSYGQQRPQYNTPQGQQGSNPVDYMMQPVNYNNQAPPNYQDQNIQFPSAKESGSKNVMTKWELEAQDAETQKKSMESNANLYSNYQAPQYFSSYGRRDEMEKAGEGFEPRPQDYYKRKHQVDPNPKFMTIREPERNPVFRDKHNAKTKGGLDTGDNPPSRITRLKNMFAINSSQALPTNWVMWVSILLMIAAF